MNRQTFFDLIICAAEGMILFYFADKILERRFKNHVILILSCMLHICTVYMLNSAPIVVKIPVSVMVFFILSILNFSDKITVIAGSTAYAFYIIIASDFIFADLISLFQNTDIYNTVASYDNSTVFFAFAIKMINFTLYSLSIKNFRKINKNSRSFGIITLDIIFICFLLISSVLVVLYPTVTYNPQQMTLFFILSMIFFITSFLILNLYVKLCDYFEKEKYWAITDIKYNSLRNQINLQQEFIESSNKFRHDIKKILGTINYFNTQKQYDSLSSFLGELSIDKYSHKPIVYCKDQFINAVLNIKAKECESKGIVMNIMASCKARGSGSDFI